MKKRTAVLIGVAALVVAAGSAVGLAASLGAFSSSSRAALAPATTTLPPPDRGPGLGGGYSGGLGSGGRFGGGAFGSLGAAATYLGVSSSELFSDLRGGKTLAALAKSKGKTASGLVDAMVASEKQSLASELSSGRITQAQEQQRESSLQQQITSLVNNGFGAGRGFGGFGGGGFGGGRPPSHTPTAQL